MNRPIVLIVDDEPLIATMVEGTFEDAGFEVRSAIDAEDAAVQIRELNTGLSALITDIRLGNGPNGWAVAVDARTLLRAKKRARSKAFCGRSGSGGCNDADELGQWRRFTGRLASEHEARRVASTGDLGT